jgi:hypothetical protein
VGVPSKDPHAAGAHSMAEDFVTTVTLRQIIATQLDELAGLRQINRLQAEALADERALNRHYQVELKRLRSQSESPPNQA